MAATYMEVPDAGELPGTAQSIVGLGALDAIEGMTSGLSDYADMYQIFISNPAAFSASTINAGTNFDTQLFLFNLAGLDVLAHDDKVPVAPGLSELPVGLLTGGAGLYYLAISGFDYEPVSADGFIFPNNFFSVDGPTGPGGGSAVTDWIHNSLPVSSGKYQIDLTGAEFVNGGTAPIPEPSTMLLLGSGLVGLIGYRMKKAKA